MIHTRLALRAVLLLAASSVAIAQAIPAAQQAVPAPPAAPRTPPAPLQVPNPHYVSIPMTVDVNAPVDKVWARIGKFCDIAEWSMRPCNFVSGSGDFGTVRNVANEILVAKTQYGYSYTQPPRIGVIYNQYHGTLEAVPLTPTTTRLNYTLMFDNSMLADDAARTADMASRRTRFTAFLMNMKTLAEGGTLPAPPAAAAPAATPAPPINANAHWVSIPMKIDVNAPIDKVWARVGKFCDIGEWGRYATGCTILSGTGDDFGEIRSVGPNEVIVGRTRYSYTYAQPLRTSGAYTMYHGTLEAVALTPSTTELKYTVLVDDSPLPDDAAKLAATEGRRTRFNVWLANMKTLAEGGTLPPLPPPATAGVPAVGPAR